MRRPMSPSLSALMFMEEQRRRIAALPLHPPIAMPSKPERKHQVQRVNRRHRVTSSFEGLHPQRFR